MSIEVPVTVLRVFCGDGGRGGNRLGVVLEGPAVAPDDRQQLARILGYSETVFVDHAPSGRVRIFTPEVELPFAGHPVVGTGWLLRRQGHPAEALLTPAGKVRLRHDEGRGAEGGRCWATARAEWSPPFELIELDSPEEVDAQSSGGEGWRYVWSWSDESAGIVRARCFVPEAGIAEDEATGSAAVRLCAALGRELEIRQGRGSVIAARALPAEEAAPLGGEADWVEFGGIVVPD